MPGSSGGVSSAPPRTLMVEVYGPLARSDLTGLYTRTCRLLREHEIQLVLCSVAGVSADAVAVEALARLKLAAGRRGAEVRLVEASVELVKLVDLMGLAEALPEGA